MKPTTRVTTVTLAAIDKFRSSLYAKGRSPKTVAAYSTDLRLFLAATQVGTDQPIRMEEFDELAASWLTMSRRTMNPKTIARRKTSLRAFAKWAGWGEVLVDYSAPQSSVPVPHPLPEGIAGVRKMIETANTDKQRCLVILCGLFGCRIGEALKIRASNFNIETRLLRIVGKGDKERFVPASNEAWALVEMSVLKSFANGDSLLVDLQDRHARRVITELGKRCNFRRPIASHDLRATFATEVHNKTRNVRLVQDLLGHASVKTTQIYLGIRLEELREAVEL